jgi:aromatic-amino-acid transaminase
VLSQPSARAAKLLEPATHGGKIVATVLASDALRGRWEAELAQMRERIRDMRDQLVERIQARVPGADFSFVARQRGMFSYSGLSKDQVRLLREEFAVRRRHHASASPR